MPPRDACFIILPPCFCNCTMHFYVMQYCSTQCCNVKDHKLASLHQVISNGKHLSLVSGCFEHQASVMYHVLQQCAVSTWPGPSGHAKRKGSQGYRNSIQHSWDSFLGVQSLDPKFEKSSPAPSPTSINLKLFPDFTVNCFTINQLKGDSPWTCHYTVTTLENTCDRQLIEKRFYNPFSLCVLHFILGRQRCRSYARSMVMEVSLSMQLFLILNASM